MHKNIIIYIGLKTFFFPPEEFCRFHKFLGDLMTSIGVYFLSILNKSKETDVALILLENSMGNDKKLWEKFRCLY